jgi:uncharacterized protein (TIGR03067 family)
MRRLILFCILGATCCGCTPDRNQRDGKLIGTWDAVSLDSGKGPEGAAGIQMTISPERITVRRPNGDTEVWGEIVKLDLDRIPHEIDIRDSRGTWLGIIELKGHQLKLVARDPGEERPKEFKGSMKGLLFIMKRAS